MENNTKIIGSKKSDWDQLFEDFMTGKYAGYKRLPTCFEQKYGKIEIVDNHQKVQNQNI